VEHGQTYRIIYIFLFLLGIAEQLPTNFTHLIKRNNQSWAVYDHAHTYRSNKLIVGMIMDRLTVSSDKCRGLKGFILL